MGQQITFDTLRAGDELYDSGGRVIGSVAKEDELSVFMEVGGVSAVRIQRRLIANPGGRTALRLSERTLAECPGSYSGLIFFDRPRA